MEVCNSEIRISFSLPELDLIRRALERFGHIETDERPLSTQSDQVQHVDRVLHKITPVHFAVKGEMSLSERTRRTETEKPLMDGAAAGGYLFSRGELEEIL